MKHWVKLLKKIIGILLVLVVVLLRWFSLYESQVILSDTKLTARWLDYTDRVETDYYQREGRRMHYIDLGDVSKPMVVLIHGAPWSISDWKRFLEDSSLYDEFRFVVMDRLGYGRSGQWKSVTSFEDQSASILGLVASLPDESGEKPIIMGHSYGGTMVAKILMEGSGKLAGWIVVAGAVDPEHEIVFWISYVVQFPVLKQLMGPMLRVANDEKLTHVWEIEDALQDFDSITVPTHIIHGDTDSIVPFANAKYLFDRIDPDLVSLAVYEWVDHPMQYNNYLDLRQELRAFYFRINN